MVGQAMLRQCLLGPGVERILAIGRSSVGIAHAKVRELVRADLFEVGMEDGTLGGYDVCFFCLGVVLRRNDGGPVYARHL